MDNYTPDWSAANDIKALLLDYTSGCRYNGSGTMGVTSLDHQERTQCLREAVRRLSILADAHDR